MKRKLKDSIKSVLLCVEELPLENGAKVMYHFLNGILAGGAIDLEKEVMDAPLKFIDDLLKENRSNEIFEKKEKDEHTK